MANGTYRGASMSEAGAVTPDRIFGAVQGYLTSAVIKGAVDLDVFTAIGEGATTAVAIAERCQASERGVRILCDYLSVLGFLHKQAGSYTLAADTAAFLDKRSPQYIGAMTDFLLSDFFIRDIGDVAAAVRKGGVVTTPRGSDEPGHPMWVDFARSMTGLQQMPAAFLAGLVELPDDRASRVLDIAAGPGAFGIHVALRFPLAGITAVDWDNVLAVTMENAQAAGVAERIRLLPGDAFEVDFGTDYDAVLVPNFLHHFDMETNINFLRRVGAAMRPGAGLYVLEFVPDDSRVEPARPAMFAMQMLRQTPGGDAYTLAELREMMDNAGFDYAGAESPPGAPMTVVHGRRPA